MATTYWAIDDGNGNQLTTGLDGQVARKTAQRMANERGESVYLYDAGSPIGGDGEPDTTIEAEEIAPEPLLQPRGPAL